MAALNGRSGRGAFVFIGHMGAGKSTAAAELAHALGVVEQDSDRLLEERLGRSIAEEFAQAGEESFRAREEELVLELLANADERSVIALGGGSVLSERVRDALGPHLTVLLDIDPDSAWERVRDHPHGRPLAGEKSRFLELHAERMPLYEQLADAYLPRPKRGLAARALRGLSTLAEAPPGTRLLWASARSGEYPVLVGAGLLRPAVAERVWPLERAGSRPFCVSDETVAGLYGASLGALQALVEITPGERHKTIASAERIWSELLAQGMTRADHLVALGGGVVGDLAGFCAATYQRGVPIVQVPTTLVAQVDSAYGGKTGVDLPQAKNYVGAYHQPAGVIVDPGTLATLPERERAAGWVEVLKTALIAGGELWRSVLEEQPLDERVILRCARAKLEIVAEDERDAGRRQVLNLGHTVGHAIETASGYGRYRHGEAVGLGLLAALRLSEQPQLYDRVRELLLGRGLPVTLEGASVEDVLTALARDKKRLDGDVPFVLLNAPGEAISGVQMPLAQVRAAVRELT
jgi:3-dehydroquinate synthase